MPNETHPAAQTPKRPVTEAERAQLLLDVTNAVVSNLSLKDLLFAVSDCLRATFNHDFASVVLCDEATGQLRVHALDAPAPGGLLAEGTLLPFEGTPPGLAIRTRRPVLRRRIDLTEFDSPAMRLAYEAGLRSGCSVPLVSHGVALGAINVASRRESAFDEDDARLLEQLAGQVAVAVANVLNFERATRERARAEALLEVNNAITTHLDLRDVMRAASACLREFFHHDVAGMALYDPEIKQLRVHALDPTSPADQYIEEGFAMSLDETPAGRSFTTRRPVLLHRFDLAEFPSPVMRKAIAAGLRSSVNAPLVCRDRVLGAVAVASRRESAFTEADAELLSHIARQLAIAVENALQFREIEALKNRLASEKRYLEEEIKTEYNFAEVVGQSRALRKVLEAVETVAPTDSVVLICGETGTGKELIARAIHDLSGRRERTMVKVNCAAIPTGLLESEFFGHERGAFTGAVTQRVGRFELAHRATLFLDEVGEIPLELQPKLLRVLQEQEFERLGGSRTIRVDARLVAATNCDLRQMVAEKKFRADLFYRLNVFPILLPPLRERAEDIPLLAGYFTQKHALRMNKRVESIPSATIEALCRYPWPGNVRELENFVERAVILTRGSELQAPLAELAPPDAAPPAAAAAPARLLSLAEAERAHIEEILRQTRGVVGGRGGAAEILGLPISTLRGRMKKLGLM
jgi:formate hydrogenlyase transcriptional activator